MFGLELSEKTSLKQFVGNALKEVFSDSSNPNILSFLILGHYQNVIKFQKVLGNFLY